MMLAYIYNINKNILYLIMLFSIETGLGRVRIVGPKLELSLGLMLRSPAKASSKEDRRGSPVDSPMPKSILP